MKKRSLITLVASLLLVSAGFVACDVDEGAKFNTLKVEPNESIEFLASDNDNVSLTVTTDDFEWEFTKPDWVTASRDADGVTLVVNVQDNPDIKPRVGNITFTADGARDVVIPVSQRRYEEDVIIPDADAIPAVFEDKTGELQFTVNLNSVKVAPTITLNDPALGDIELEVVVDEEYLTEYNFINGTKCELFPPELVRIANSGEVTIAKGESDADVSIEFRINPELVYYTIDYLIPLRVKAKTSNVNISGAESRINYRVKRESAKEVKNVLYFEVNDVNPLNALEFVMEDGELFFDAVVLFAANIRYSAAEDVVFLYNNPNVQNLLNESDTYLQPLRRKGVKVYLGILGDHTAAGVAQLSDWGAREFALELAHAVDLYNLDGLSFDDEYSTTPIIGNKWFTSASPKAASRLMYECKKAMREVCGTDKDVMAYYLNDINTNMGSVTDDGAAHQPGSFIDIVVNDYGWGAAAPLLGMTKKQCSGNSLQLGNKNTMTKEEAQELKKEGYGWVMYFNLNPNNYKTSIPTINNVAQGLYGMDLITPTHYYKMEKDVQFFPDRFPIDFLD